MATRLQPLKIVEEHDIVPFYALGLDYANESFADSGTGDIGVLVAIDKADLDQEEVVNIDTDYLGKTKPKHLGTKNLYPVNPLQVKPAVKGDVLLGVTSWGTAKYDDNGEKLLNKLDVAAANHVQIPGRSVPIVTRGWLSFNINAFDVADEADPQIEVNDKLTLSGTKAGKWAKAVDGDEVYGIVRGKGTTQDDAALPYFLVQFWAK